jgi:ketosteroid isomerase-like protein
MRALMLAALLVCLGTPAGQAQADSDLDTESKIIAMEHVWAEAYRANDARALNRILDDKFVCVTSNGRLLTKAQILVDVKTATAIQILMDSMVVRVHGDTAIISGIFRTKGVEHGKTYELRERFVDTWLYRNGQWVSVASIVTPTGA